MYGEIALLANQIHFCHDARPDQLLENWLVEKADQVVLVGSFERGIRPMKPGDQRLIGSPCVEDRRPWIAVGVMPGSLRFFRSARPSRTREGEVAHPIPFTSCRQTNGIDSGIGARPARSSSRILGVRVS